MLGERHRYLIALGGNVRHHRHGPPEAVLRAAMVALEELGRVRACSNVLRSSPLGPSKRCYANAALVLETRKRPRKLLHALKTLERKFDRRGGGQRWSARTLDLDIVLWSGGAWGDDALTIPHPEFRRRDFVLRPAAAIAPQWRDPLTGLTVAQLLFRLRRQGA
ncbi:2-amino-4-hydroxy-6-hydroxymethyldihydropteridine diphosphokinase [Croceicoccus sp. BE223]|uniref:2-amino-4-hydroxy-6- hydroxymethyldihydropteridine diphosphokinase n=1 Tax=Croceicoccus sp. BE223 TaxID=2817716 RepID=UPI00285FFF1D|nr:2-amino-4-hydroxy-6-hydroxymethyldihydropteridine diphosphokinase [Croceicoccus sp. BE223]MDR7102843.1 2-amino-4-hydroxy-6-hydroxymethyldihydropteridine diphosphokinase [Croceicoccus sp. BE223]